MTPSRKVSARTPTAVLEIKSIPLDMKAFNKSCSVEAATRSALPSPRRPAVRLCALVQRHQGGLASKERRKQRTAKERTRRNQRRSRRSEKKACSDIIEESSSVDEVDARRKCPRSWRESQYSCLTHLRPDTSLHFHITTLSAHSYVFQWSVVPRARSLPLDHLPQLPNSNLGSLMITVDPPHCPLC